MPRSVLHWLWPGDSEKKSPPSHPSHGTRAERLRRPAPVAGRPVGRGWGKKIFDVHPETPATSRPWYASLGAAPALAGGLRKKITPLASIAWHPGWTPETAGSRSRPAGRPAGGGWGKKYSILTPKLRPLAARGMPRTVLHRVWPGDAEKNHPLASHRSQPGFGRPGHCGRRLSRSASRSGVGKKKSSKFTPIPPATEPRAGPAGPVSPGLPAAPGPPAETDLPRTTPRDERGLAAHTRERGPPRGLASPTDMNQCAAPGGTRGPPGVAPMYVPIYVGSVGNENYRFLSDRRWALTAFHQCVPTVFGKYGIWTLPFFKVNVRRAARRHWRTLRWCQTAELRFLQSNNGLRECAGESMLRRVTNGSRAIARWY